nr:hypothetical protein 37 [Balneolaceae bacterium]
MRVKHLIEKLKRLPQDKSVLCQLTAQESPEAWNMMFEFYDLEDMQFVQLNVFHPTLKTMPEFPKTNEDTE